MKGVAPELPPAKGAGRGTAVSMVPSSLLDLLKSEVFNGDVLEMFNVWACLLFRSYPFLVWGVVVDRPIPLGTYYDFSVETVFERD